MLTQSKYDEIFKSNRKVHKKALKQAYEIRKFEIDLYWKRAAYFWTFIGVAFAGYAAAYSTETKGPAYTLADKELLLIIISCIGVVFSVAWHYVNKGGKFWQENWENHVELLENEIFGPLYKTIAKRPKRASISWKSISDLLTKPEPFSVSKINQIVSTFTALIWISMLVKSSLPICFEPCFVDYKKAVPISLTIATCLAIRFAGKSHQDSHHPTVSGRTATIEVEKPASNSIKK